MNTNAKNIATDFIEVIWNQYQLSKIDLYLHPDFIDHSLPATLPRNKEGLKKWVAGTGASFEHKTIIEEMVCENDKVILKIKMLLKHTGKWRGIDPTNIDISTPGYRFLKFRDNKIIEHWALIDGNTIENQIKEAKQRSESTPD